jgi:hypothetical protein
VDGVGKLCAWQCASTHFVVTYPLIVVLGVLVQPYFAQPDAVPLEHVHAAAPLVRRAFPKDVTHVRARHDLQGACERVPNRRINVAERRASTRPE